MAAIVLVPDPTWQGKGEAPLMIRTYAMRKLFEAGKTVSEVALHFDTTYHNAYKAINPPRKRASDPKSTAVKPLTASRLTQLSKKQLEKIAYGKGKTPTELARIEAAADELIRRDPNWLEG